MGHCYHHALSSVRKWGGTAEDYLPLHQWFDESKEITADFRHRALRHHAQGIFELERTFGATITIATGLATVALGLLAHDLAGANAGEILGIALSIKMIAYVGVAPFASVLTARSPRKTLLVALDVVRMSIAAVLPFVSEAWQVYGLMTVLYVASAAFTPAFQATIPDLLSDEAEYTKALSLSRLASDLESVASPVAAAVLLSFIGYNDVFAGTSLGFGLSALLVVSAILPRATKAAPKPFVKRLTAGLHLFMLTPRLRGLIAMSLATAAGGAMVFINTVVLVQSRFGLSQQATAWALAVFGGGSMLAAVVLPRLLAQVSDRMTMATGAGLMTVALLLGPWLAISYAALLALWAVIGFGYSLTITPAGRALRRSSDAENRPALYAAQFALSHAAWLIAYPIAGLVSATTDPAAAFLVLAVLCAMGGGLGLLLWPAHDPEILEHRHDDLDSHDPHIVGAEPSGDTDAMVHAHPFVIDDRHRRLPTASG